VLIRQANKLSEVCASPFVGIGHWDLLHAQAGTRAAPLSSSHALLGCGWLIAKTEGEVQRRLFRVVLPLTVLQVHTIAIVTLWTPLLDPIVAARLYRLAG
jgi:cytochrome bd-type quinol oxidase subunit 2